MAAGTPAEQWEQRQQVRRQRPQVQCQLQVQHVVCEQVMPQQLHILQNPKVSISKRSR
jgi:hypothetical protein